MGKHLRILSKIGLLKQNHKDKKKRKRNELSCIQIKEVYLMKDT